jgi:hypothetical protein
MGWSSGTELFSSVITSAKKSMPDAETRKMFYKEVINAFEDQDWDTQDECVGVDTAFDEALKELHPNWYKDE